MVTEVDVSVADAIVDMLAEMPPARRFLTLAIAARLAVTQGVIKLNMGREDSQPHMVALLEATATKEELDRRKREGRTSRDVQEKSKPKPKAHHPRPTSA
jgi:hypothetical protein